MKIAEINMYTTFSTGKIMIGIAECIRENGHEARTYTPKTFRGFKPNYPLLPNHTYYGTDLAAKVHCYGGMAFGLNGFFSRAATKQLVKELDMYQPDIVHLHNLHAFCFNLPILFGYLKKKHIKVVWTLHDCWPFTGHCPHFQLAKCDKWRTGCGGCKQLNVYPRTYVDNTKWMWKQKKKLFSGLDMVLVTPSEWLAGLVKQSFLKEYPIKVINNGIDLSVFKPTESDFRALNDLIGKKVILGVAAVWGERKGLDVFIDLAARLDSKYQIVLVGTNEKVDTQLPSNIISIHRTQDQKELAEIYSAADLFVNPTREEVFGMVNAEALACGAPIVTFDTGGSPECIDETCGSVVACDDNEALIKEIVRICERHPFSASDCLQRATRFNMNVIYKEYLELYENCTHST